MAILGRGLTSKLNLRLLSARRLLKSQGRTLNRLEPSPFGGCEVLLAADLLGFTFLVR